MERWSGGAVERWSGGVVLVLLLELVLDRVGRREGGVLVVDGDSDR